MRRLVLLLAFALLAASPAWAQRVQTDNAPQHVVVDDCLGAGCGGVAGGPAVNLVSVAGNAIVGPNVPTTVASGSITFTNTSLAVTNTGTFAVQCTSGCSAGTPGQTTMANSAPVVIASDQSAVPVSGTFWPAVQTVSGTFWQSTQPVSHANFANLDTALSTLLTTAAFQARINTLGQKALASSTPVVLASDTVTGTVTTLGGSVLAPSGGAGTVSVSIAGTFVGTLTFIGVDGAGNSDQIYGLSFSTGDPAVAAVAAGNFLVPAAGYSSVGVQSIGWTSGTANVALMATPGAHVVALGRSLPSGTNPIGQVTANAGTNLNTSALALEATQLTGNGSLASIKTNTDPLVTASGGGYVRQDSTATIAKESGGNLASLAAKDFATSAKQDIENTSLASLVAALIALGGSPTTTTAALQTLALPVAPGLPKFPCNAVRRINCAPKGF